MAIKFNKDIPVGAIVTSTKKNKYLVCVDDAGQRGLFTKTGTWFRFNGDGLVFGKNDSGVIDKIDAFDTLPPLDALSEGIKYIYTGRTPCAHMTTVYTREDPAVTEARKALATAEAEAARLRQTIDGLNTFIRNNT